jgi:predicted nucleic acid-binding protein
MRLFLDTNVFVASLTDEPSRGDAADALLDRDCEFSTSLLNLMELRTVLAKKNRIEQSVVRGIIADIDDRIEVFYHDTTDLLDANRLQQDTLLYPLDCLLLTAADDMNATLVTFDTELIDAGAVTPEEALDSLDSLNDD